MVCRTTPGGRVVTPHIRLMHGWDDAQCTSLYHRLRRWAYENNLTTESDEYLAEIYDIRRETLRLPDITPAARSRAITRIDEALLSPLPSGPDMWATRHCRSEARLADAKLSTELHAVGIALDIPQGFVREEFERLRREMPVSDESWDPVPYPIPNDIRTRYALNTIAEMHRCALCGQFVNRAVANTHTCPSGTGGMEGNSNDLQATPRQEGIAVSQVMATSPNIIREIDIDRFQEIYDAARERIRDGDLAVPSLEELEAIPGGVTGGLSGPNGTTFGIEIEIDFPDDEYPYSARDELARRLFNEGIAMSPSVARWHFLGGEGEDRPGGEYQHSANDWSCEFDRTVDNVEGERGVEIKSQILTDIPDTWRNLRRICEIARELGGRPTRRTGVHVNIGADDFPDDDPLVHLRLLRILESMDDTLIRLAHNPESGARHRGRNYCAPVRAPGDDLMDVSQVKLYAGHYHAVNLGHLPDEYTERTSSSRIEMRIFDSSLDVGRLQSQVNISLAVAKAAAAGDDLEIGRQHAGYARETFGGRRLSGARWEEATLPFRRFAALMEKHGVGSPAHLKQLVHLFAESRWPYSA